MTERPQLPRIQSVRPRPHHRLEIKWQHGETSIVDMRQTIASGGVFDALRDYDFFATVRLGDRGRLLEWPDPLRKDQILADYDADSLMRLADQQAHLSTLEEFGRKIKAFRDRLIHRAGETA